MFTRYLTSRAATAAAVVALVAVLSGCSPNAPVNTGGSPAPTSGAPTTGPVTATQSADPADFTSTIATAKTNEIAVSDEEGGPTSRTVKAADVLTVPDQTPLVFLVKQVTEWGVEVYLPIRPNGSTGWVAHTDVTLVATDYSLDVYLSEHRLTLSQAGEQLVEYPIATGATDLPTPGGVYYIRELLAPPNPDGVYGPYAYGLSGYSPVLDSFAGGDAVIGIHGTNEPEKIGTNVSHGCIRLLNDDISQLVEQWQLPLGTPVHIHE